MKNLPVKNEKKNQQKLASNFVVITCQLLCVFGMNSKLRKNPNKFWHLTVENFVYAFIQVRIFVKSSERPMNRHRHQYRPNLEVRQGSVSRTTAEPNDNISHFFNLSKNVRPKS